MVWTQKHESARGKGWDLPRYQRFYGVFLLKHRTRPWRRLTLEIDLSGLRGEFGPGHRSRVSWRSGNISARKGSDLQGYQLFKGSLRLNRRRDPYLISGSQACAVERFRPWTPIRYFYVVRKRGNVLLMLRCPDRAARQNIKMT